MLTRRAAVARSGRRPARRPGSLRAAILRAARRLHAARGADAVTARALAQAVGVSPTAIYLHFRSLDDVFEQLRMEGHARLAGYLEGARGETAPERLRAMGRAYFRFGAEQPADFDLMFHGRPGAARRRDAVHREMFTLLHPARRRRERASPPASSATTWIRRSPPTPCGPRSTA